MKATLRENAITETTERILKDITDCIRRCKEIAQHRENVISQCYSTFSSLTSLPSLSLLTASSYLPSQGEQESGGMGAVQSNLRDRFVWFDFCRSNIQNDYSI